MNKLLHHILIILTVINLVLPAVVLAQGKELKQYPQLPETFEEAWSFIKKIIDPLPKAIGKVWQEAVGIWQRMADWFINIWNSKIWPKIDWIWQQIFGIFSQEVEKRKEELPQELEKEKEEIKEEFKEQTSKAGKSLWQRLKALIR